VSINNKKHTMKKLFYSLFIGTLAFSACSDKDEDPGVKEHQSAKITISVSDAFKKTERDDFSITVLGTSSKGSLTSWEVNGEAVTNQNVTLNADDFDGGGTFVIESTAPFYAAGVELSGFNFGPSFKVNYKIEIDGKVENSEMV